MAVGTYAGDPEQGFGVHVLHEEPNRTLFVPARRRAGRPASAANRR
jgi:hypothetical protein